MWRGENDSWLVTETNEPLLVVIGGYLLYLWKKKQTASTELNWTAMRFAYIEESDVYFNDSTCKLKSLFLVLYSDQSSIKTWRIQMQ